MVVLFFEIIVYLLVIRVHSFKIHIVHVVVDRVVAIDNERLLNLFGTEFINIRNHIDIKMVFKLFIDDLIVLIYQLYYWLLVQLRTYNYHILFISWRCKTSTICPISLYFVRYIVPEKVIIAHLNLVDLRYIV